MTVKKFIGKIHLWLGLTSGLVVFILSVTGCIWVFKDEISSVVYKDRLFINPQSSPVLSVSDLRRKAQEAIGRKYFLQNAIVYNAPDRTAVFRAYKDNPDAWNCFDEVIYHYHVFVNPYNGEIVHIQNTEWEFFELVLWLHWSLFLSNDIGQPVVGISVIIFVIMLLTGLILWWPKNKKAAKQRFWFRWKDTTKWRRKNYDLHTIPGFYMLVISLIIGLTGLVFAFSWFYSGVDWIANGGSFSPEKPQLFSDTTKVRTVNTIDYALDQTKKKNPEAYQYYIQFPSDHKQTIYIQTNPDKSKSYNRIRYQYDQKTGSLLLEDNSSASNGERLLSLNYDLHVGSILGLPTKILAFIASFICAMLPITGFYIWWGRKKKEKKKLAKAQLKAQPVY